MNNKKCTNCNKRPQHNYGQCKKCLNEKYGQKTLIKEVNIEYGKDTLKEIK